jgi:hypothetical protein
VKLRPVEVDVLKRDIANSCVESDHTIVRNPTVEVTDRPGESTVDRLIVWNCGRANSELGRRMTEAVSTGERKSASLAVMTA